GLAAAPYLGVYTAVAVYAAIVVSASAGLAATAFASACFLSVALAQQAGSLAMPTLPPHAWGTASFNLLVLNIVASLTGLLAEAFRRNRRRVRETEARFQALAGSAGWVAWGRAAGRFGRGCAGCGGRRRTEEGRSGGARRVGGVAMPAGGVPDYSNPRPPEILACSPLLLRGRAQSEPPGRR